MKQYFFLSVMISALLSACFPARSQKTIREYTAANAHPVRTVNPADNDYSDLDTIGAAIGDAQVVFLGEQDHGDAPAYLAKTRLIKYLHEQKGFNVLAFESDFFALEQGWQEYEKADRNRQDSFLRTNLFPLWSRCDACADLLYAYLPAQLKSGQPLRVTGFDDQLVMRYSRQHLAQELDSLLTPATVSLTKTNDYRLRLLPYLDSLPFWYYRPDLHRDEIAQGHALLLRLQSALVNQKGVNAFTQQLVSSIVSMSSRTAGRKAQAISRDAAMASNLLWLCTQRYSSEKIIVWAANYHIARNYGNATDTRPGTTTMGTYLQATAPKLTSYVLGFSSQKGVGGRPGEPPYSFEAPKAGWEQWVPANLNYSFVDFKIYANRYLDSDPSFSLQAFGHQSQQRNWMKSFDGLFFIRTMYPCTVLP